MSARYFLPASLGAAFTVLGILALVDKPEDMLAATILFGLLTLAVIARWIAEQHRIRARYGEPEFWDGHFRITTQECGRSYASDLTPAEYAAKREQFISPDSKVGRARHEGTQA